MKDKKIALIIATAGGFIINFEQRDIQILKGKGYEIHCAADFNNKIYEYRDSFWSDNGVIIHQVDFGKNPYKFMENYRAYRQLRQVIGELSPQLVHCHNPIAAALTRLAVANDKSVRVVYTAHGFHFYKGAPFSSIIYKLAEGFLARYTDVLITINEEDYRAACRFKLREGGIVRKIPGVGIDLQRFCPTASADRTDCYNIVSVGELNENKNHLLVIRSLAMLRCTDNRFGNIRYRIYGNGPYRAKLEEAIKLYGLEQTVELCGYCEDTAGMLSACDLFIFPSIREGLGMAAIEALACGVPVLALNQRGAREFLEAGKNGYFSENEPGSMASCIKKMLSLTDEEYEMLSQRASESARRFDEKNTIKIMREIY